MAAVTSLERTATRFPEQPLLHLDTLWIQVAGTLCNLECTHCFVVKSFSIHRIQETHVALYHIVWDLVHVALGEDDVL